MIKQLRIDERLIHGQIATAWAKLLNVDMICVANDAAFNDPIQSSALKMACPPGRKCNIRTVDDMAVLLQDPRAEALSILLIVNCPKDALKLCSILKVSEVNCANYAQKWGTYPGSIRCTPGHFFVAEEDIDIVKQIADLPHKPHVFSQLIPANIPNDVLPQLK